MNDEIVLHFETEFDGFDVTNACNGSFDVKLDMSTKDWYNMTLEEQNKLAKEVYDDNVSWGWS